MTSSLSHKQHPLNPDFVSRKEAANEKFRSKDFQSAKEMYLNIMLDLLPQSLQNSIELCIIYLNLAATCLELSDYKDCVSFCDKVLELDSSNGKAHFRRGKAHFYLEEYTKSFEDFQLALTHLSNQNPSERKLVEEIKKYEAKLAKLHQDPIVVPNMTSSKSASKYILFGILALLILIIAVYWIRR